jgi:hypothetical protein
MITNLIDGRKSRHRWKTVNAVLESTYHDNCCDDADQAREDGEDEVLYEERLNISIAEAMAWGMSVKAEVTLYLYDQGQGI